MSLSPQNFFEVVYGLPPIVASAWGVMKVVQGVRGPRGNGAENPREREARAELERTRWTNVLSAIEGVGRALKEETALVAAVRENQTSKIIPKVAAIHEEVVDRREEHKILMQELMGRRGRRS